MVVFGIYSLKLGARGMKIVFFPEENKNQEVISSWHATKYVISGVVTVISATLFFISVYS